MDNDGSTAQTYATNKNITFQALKTTTTITFQVSFANGTPKAEYLSTYCATTKVEAVMLNFIPIIATANQIIKA